MNLILIVLILLILLGGSGGYYYGGPMVGGGIGGLLLVILIVWLLLGNGRFSSRKEQWKLPSSHSGDVPRSRANAQAGRTHGSTEWQTHSRSQTGSSPPTGPHARSGPLQPYCRTENKILVTLRITV